MMKNKLLVALVSLAAVASLTGCDASAASSLITSIYDTTPIEIIIPEANTKDTVDNSNKVAPESLMLNRRNISLIVEEDCVLSGVEQINHTGKNLAFVSANPEVATVDEDGKVTAVAAGETTITVSDKNNPELTKVVPVIVSASITSSKAKSIADALGEIDEKSLNAAVLHEFYEKTTYKNDVALNYSRLDVLEVASYDDAYFRFCRDEAEIRNEEGSMGFMNRDYIFYTDPFFDTYIFHQSGDVKNYYPVATQSYMDGSRFTPVLEILDNFFTSGRKIFTNVIDNAKMSDFLGSVGSTSTQILDQFAGSNGAGQLVFDYTLDFSSQTADMDDERYYGIPFGTAMPTTQRARYTVKDNKLIATYIYLESTYEIGEDKYKDIYYIDETFERVDAEKSQIYVPNRKDYTLVDSAFSV